jgi:hypothetical protein
LLRLQRLRDQLGLVQNLPELVLLVGVVSPGRGGHGAGSSAAQDDAKGILQQVLQDVRYIPGYRFAHPVISLLILRSALARVSKDAGDAVSWFETPLRGSSP